ncbi:patatin-like protein [Streptomyces sp. BF23-19]|uniref:patatin-like protein n=1 Tax=unclassified Streptomyces TaxID=2593676 RepID=UPI0034E4D058
MGHEQTRLALVLNGGVSLAVWMGGVAHEMDLLRRASRFVHSDREDREEQLEPRDKAAFAIWKSVVESAHTTVLIDVISGTSAGGLNGSLLAAAIGRGAALPDLRSTWRDAAALTDDRLLHEPPDNSVLDGGYFATEIGRILDSMCKNEGDAEPVTLFVTATAIDGQPEILRDGFGGKFEVSDHRRIYKFQHDPDAVAFRRTSAACNTWGLEPAPRSDFFEKKRLGRLNLAARASAGFPVAFAPVDESPLLEQRVRPDPEIPSRGRDRASWLVDGGLLNNAPFGPVLDAIADRRVDAPVRRVVVYIVPSTGVTQRHMDDNLPGRATEWPSVLGTAITYPREADFRSGTAELCDRMRSQTFDRQLQLFARHVRPNRRRGESRNVAELPDALALATSLFGDYRRSRLRALAWKVRQLRDEGRGVRNLVGIPYENVNGALESLDLKWVPSSDAALTPQPPASGWKWPWGTGAAERLVWTLVGDLNERMRTKGTSAPCAPTEEAAEARATIHEATTWALGQLSECVRSVRAAQDALFRLIRAADATGGAPARRIAADRGPYELVDVLFGELGLQTVLGEQVQKAVRAYVDAAHHLPAEQETDRESGADDAPPPPTFEQTLHACLITEVIAQAFASPEEINEHTPLFEFLRLGPDGHSPVFPLDEFAPLGERKLYGKRLSHFGAFVDPQWRLSDFTWGRLDASHHLLRLFVADHTERARIETKLHEAVLAAEIGKARMRRNLHELAEPDDSKLFDAFLATRKGRDTAGRVMEASLAVAVGKHGPFRGVWVDAVRLTSWAAFGRRVKWWAWLVGFPVRLMCTPARLWWWRRVRSKPAKTLPTTLLAGFTALLSSLLAAYGIALAVMCLVGNWDDFTALIAGIAAGGILVLYFAVFLVFLWVAALHRRWKAWQLSRRQPTE